MALIVGMLMLVFFLFVFVHVFMPFGIEEYTGSDHEDQGAIKCQVQVVPEYEK